MAPLDPDPALDLDEGAGGEVGEIGHGLVSVLSPLARFCPLWGGVVGYLAEAQAEVSKGGTLSTPSSSR